MKAKRASQSKRRPPRPRRFAIEALEPRFVLDGQLGMEAAELAANVSGFEKFESEDQLQQFLVEAAVDQWKDLFGTKTQRWHYTPYYSPALDALVSISQSNTSARSLVNNFDGTNIQVSGIDEADLVKTDGDYLYIATEGHLSIIDVRNPAELSLASQVELDSYSSEMYVNGDRLMLLSYEHPFALDMVLDVGLARPSYPGYDFGPRTSVSIFDISDRTVPELVQHTTFDGNVAASRRIDDLVYLVLSDTLRLPQLDMQCAAVHEEAVPEEVVKLPSRLLGAIGDALIELPPFWPEDSGESCVYETKEAYLTRVEDELIELAVPSFETTDRLGEVVASGTISAPGDTYKPLARAAYGVTSIVVVDMSAESDGPAAATSLFTDYSSTVYASARNIYLANSSYDGDGESSTTIRQFAIAADGTSVDFVAQGVAPGTLLNQFSIDEHESYLRVVTSNRWGDERTNQLHVLEQTDSHLGIVGSINEIATGESVFAVRFVGDEAFVVTFRVVDPLFTIDLTDPANPSIVGELKIPGFSNYLHPVTDDLILGFGRDEGEFGGSPQLSLFDVSDFGLPVRVDQFTFEGVTWSEAFYNHHAISYFPDSQIVVIPFHGSDGYCVDGTGAGVCHAREPNAFWVVQIDTASDEKSLQLLGTVEHEDAPLRSLRIGDHLLTVSNDTVKASHLLHPGMLLDELLFGVDVREFFHNEAEPMDTNMDGAITPLDVLVITNHINRHGSGPVNAGVARLLQASATEADAVRFALDVNRDGFISPIDALLVVNSLSTRHRVLAEGEATDTQLPGLLGLGPSVTASDREAPSIAASPCSSTLLNAAWSDASRVVNSFDEIAGEIAAHRSRASSEDVFFAELQLPSDDEWWAD